MNALWTNFVEHCESVFKTNGRPVAPGDQKLDWTSLICPWASKNYNRLYQEGTFLSISGRLSLRENFSLKHWESQGLTIQGSILRRARMYRACGSYPRT